MLAIPLLLHMRTMPAALIGIAIATGVATLADWSTATIGAIPSSLVLDDRLVPNRSDLDRLDQLLGAALAIALLGAIESLLCGVVGGRMTGKRLAVKQELFAQGVGNMVLAVYRRRACDRRDRTDECWGQSRWCDPPCQCGPIGRVASGCALSWEFDRADTAGGVGRSAFCHLLADE